MKGHSERLAIIGGVLAVAIGFIGLWARTDPRDAQTLPAAVGRPLDQVERGVDPRLAHVPAAVTEEKFRLSRAVRELTERLGGIPGPANATRALVYPFLGDLPSSTLEQGPPWHLILELDGTVTPTERLRRALPALPAGMPRQALRAWHVAVPRAGQLPGPRGEALRALLVYLAGRFSSKRGAPEFADLVPGAEFTVDPAIDRGPFGLADRLQR